MFSNKSFLRHSLDFVDVEESYRKSEQRSIITSYGHHTKTGSNPSNPMKINQDSIISNPNLISDISSINSLLNKMPSKIHLFGVCDGHGSSGRTVSSYCAAKLPIMIKSSLKLLDIEVKSQLVKCIEKVDENLRKSEIDSKNSGSTCCLVLIKDKTIHFANTGDSRAILVSFNPPGDDPKQDPIRAIYSTIDQNCELEKEKERIIEHGGRVERINKKYGPLRVWFKEHDMPGLAMTRSIGDHIARSIGVIATPEVKYFDLKHPSALIIGSDGLFEFLSNKEIAEKVYNDYYNSKKPALDTPIISNGDNVWKTPIDTCKELVEESAKRWRKNQSVVDDISCIVVYLDPDYDQ